MSRDIAAYTDTYTALPFEPVQAACRRRMILKQIASIKPRSILEIGCGQNPIFTDLSSNISVVVVEPSDTFATHAASLASPNVTVHHGYLDSLNATQDFDLVLLSSLLHEIDNPQALLASVRARCAPGTIVHVNVPNAKSLHRRLGVLLGKIPNVAAISANQAKLQQHRPAYDPAGLEAELRRAGFAPIKKGGMLIKPLTHAQMQKLMDKGLLNTMMIRGLEYLADIFPKAASEIWMNVKGEQ